MSIHKIQLFFALIVLQTVFIQHVNGQLGNLEANADAYSILNSSSNISSSNGSIFDNEDDFIVVTDESKYTTVNSALLINDDSSGDGDDTTTTTTTTVITTITPSGTVNANPIIPLNFETEFDGFVGEFLKDPTIVKKLEKSLTTFYTISYPNIRAVRVTNPSLLKFKRDTDYEYKSVSYTIDFELTKTTGVNKLKESLNQLANDLNRDVNKKTEFENILKDNLDIAVKVNSDGLVNSIQGTVKVLENKETVRDLAKCSIDSEYYNIIYDNELICLHDCDNLERIPCKNAARCEILMNYAPKCTCKSDDISHWGLSRSYHGEKCEIIHRSIGQNLFILIISLAVALTLVVIIVFLVALIRIRRRNIRTDERKIRASIQMEPTNVYMGDFHNEFTDTDAHYANETNNLPPPPRGFTDDDQSDNYSSSIISSTTSNSSYIGVTIPRPQIIRENNEYNEIPMIEYGIPSTLRI